MKIAKVDGTNNYTKNLNTGRIAMGSGIGKSMKHGTGHAGLNIIKTCGLLTLFAMALALVSCKKDNASANNNQTEMFDNSNNDHVDFAFRDLTNLFGLDTNGYTKILKQAYALNDGDYMVDTFEYSTNPDTMYSHGVFHCATTDPNSPHDIPYNSIWTRNGDTVKANFVYPWESTRTPHMPEPKLIRYVPGAAGDDAMTMYIKPGTGNFEGKVDVNGNTATYMVEDNKITNPYWVKIEENY